MKIFIRLFGLIILINSGSCCAQVLNGTWTGNYGKTLFANPTSLIVEIGITDDTIISGVSHLYYPNKKYEHHKILGKYNPHDSTAVFAESTISTNIWTGVYNVKYKMKLRSAGNQLRLEGNWKNVSGFLGYLPRNTVWLEKPGDTIPPVPTPHDSIKTESPPRDQKLKRAEDIQKIIEVAPAEKDSIEISIYDNGEIDGDSVSVYADETTVVRKKQITETPIIFYLSLEGPTPFHKITLAAENLGSIPPNTALMIIKTKTKTKRYEVHLSSDLQKNATVEFVLLE